MPILLVESKTIAHPVNGSGRLQLLDDLRKKDRFPLIRTARLSSFDQILMGAERVREFETAIADWTESEIQEPYLIGDLICLADHVLFLIFDDNKGVRAGIVYDLRTPEPFRKLDSFCRDVRESLLAQNEAHERETGSRDAVPQWEQGKPSMPEGFKRFIAKQDTDSLYTTLRKETMSKRILAASRLEDESARVFLRSAREAHQEGYAAKLLTGDRAESYELSIERLEDVGLVEREVQVSCRKTGHALLRLPNAHALAVVTVSDATCSECGSPIADEKVEEVIAPTRLASSLLEDGSWLVSRLHFLLREMGVPESEIAVGPSEGEGYGQMMANICGESFLLVARDGDLTPAFARWAIDLEIETEAAHLVVVATGRAHNQAQVLLHNHSRRRIRAGRDFELVLADEPAAAGVELRDAFERVSQRVVAEQLCELDNSLGLNVTRLVINKFKFLRSAPEHKDLSPTVENAIDISNPRPSLALAAYASASAGEIVQVAEGMPDELTSHIEDAHVDTVDIHLNSDQHASWE
ncbi:MAG TPA: hypothetical protein VJ180_16130 [Pyrinomonadaceae bacterium]|nr:hypothetical protein [Pyrinomonadaceae bacterium]